MTFALLWIAAVVTMSGVIPVQISETTKFKSRAECEAFGKEMSPRVQDYARGALKLDWSVNVVVAFRCEAPGQPA